MGRIKDKKVMKYINKIKKTFNATIILFGSRTGNDYLEESDYDLCIISEKFKDQPLRERLSLLYAEMIEEPISADILAITPGEFSSLSKKATIYKGIKEHGIPV